MVRTQIQLPNEVYARARKVCEQREISLAELARRGLEYMLSVYAEPKETHAPSSLPKPRDLGWKGLSEAEIKELAQMSSTELSLLESRKK
jgi:hypothetical protein